MTEATGRMPGSAVRQPWWRWANLARLWALVVVFSVPAIGVLEYLGPSEAAAQAKRSRTAAAAPAAAPAPAQRN